MKCSWLSFIMKKISISFDMFKAPACLRARGEPQVSRLCPGILSLLLAILFMYVLISGFVKLGRYESIGSSLIYQTQLNISSPSYSNIPISISPAWLDYVNWTRMFTVQTYLQKYTETIQDLKLEMQKCQLSQWEKHKQIFAGYAMVQNICVKNPEEVQLQGTNTYKNINFLRIIIKRCQRASQNDTTCMDDTEFNSSMEKVYRQKRNYFSVYLPDTRINQFKENAIQEFIPMTYNYPFNNISRMTAQIYLGTYVVETDRTVIPLVDDIKSQTGYYISQITSTKKDKEIQLANGYDYYGMINIYMSTDRIKYSRYIGKFDQVVSYAGGLFGLIIAFFAIFVYSYNKFSYQLLVAEHSFNYHQSGSKVKMVHFNFLKYVKFQIYQWLNIVKFLRPNWKDCEMIYQTKDEANLYLDVQYLFRKMRLIDLALERLVPIQEQKILNLTEPPCLKEVQQKRKYLEYYNEIIGGQDAANIQDFKKQIDNQTDILISSGSTGKNQRQMKLISSNSNAKNDVRSAQQANKAASTKPLFIVQQNLGSAANLQSNELKQRQQNQFMAELKQNLNIDDERILFKLCKHKNIYDEAKPSEQDKQLEQVQNQFASAYMKIDERSRMTILDKIPLKILFRLSHRIGQIKNKQSPNADNGKISSSENI